MKKMILAALVLAFFAGPALADEFKTEQIKMFDSINAELAQCQNDATKTNALTKKKECVEKAVDLNALKACLTEPSLASTKSMTD